MQIPYILSPIRAAPLVPCSIIPSISPSGMYGISQSARLSLSSYLRRAFGSAEASMLELTDMILRIKYEAVDATTLTTFLE